MNINHTKILHFLTIVKYMSMNKAARELYISQPALSLSISRLEEELGITLFYRDGNKLILSSEAEALLPIFEKLRQDYDALTREAMRLKQIPSDAVNLSFSGSASLFSALYMSDFLNNYEGNVLRLCFVEFDQAVSMLLTGQIDFAISYPPIDHPLITTANILTEPIGLVIRPGHPLAVKRRLSFEDLKGVKIHGLTEHHTFRRLCDQICASQNVRLTYATEDEYPDYYRRILHNDGHGAFFSTRDNFHMNFEPAGDYLYLEIDNQIMCRTMGISYLTGGKKQYKYDGLIEYLISRLRDQKLSLFRYSKTASQAILDNPEGG